MRNKQLTVCSLHSQLHTMVVCIRETPLDKPTVYVWLYIDNIAAAYTVKFLTSLLWFANRTDDDYFLCFCAIETAQNSSRRCTQPWGLHAVVQPTSIGTG